MPSTSLVLTAAQRADLEARVRSGRGRADAARRARVILLLADGCSYTARSTGKPDGYFVLPHPRLRASATRLF